VVSVEGALAWSIVVDEEEDTRADGIVIVLLSGSLNAIPALDGPGVFSPVLKACPPQVRNF
jgi:hypothetical protein